MRHHSNHLPTHMMTSQYPHRDVISSSQQQPSIFGNRHLTYQSKPHQIQQIPGIIPSFPQQHFPSTKLFPSTVGNHQIKREIPSPQPQPQQNHFSSQQRPQADIFSRFTSNNSNFSTQGEFSHNPHNSFVANDVINGMTSQFGISPLGDSAPPSFHPPSFSAKTTQHGDFPQLDTKLVSEVLNNFDNGGAFDGTEEKNLSLNFEKNLSIEDNLTPFHNFGDSQGTDGNQRPQMFGGGAPSSSRLGWNGLFGNIPGNPFAAQEPIVQSESGKFQSVSRNGNNNNQVSPPSLVGDSQVGGLPTLRNSFNPSPASDSLVQRDSNILKSPSGSLDLKLGLPSSPIRNLVGDNQVGVLPTLRNTLGQRSNVGHLGVLQSPKLGSAMVTPENQDSGGHLMSGTSLDLNEIDSCYLNNF